jgi:hypothetical protein
MRDKILEFMRKKGPIVPTELAGEIRTDTIIASAYLSDLLSKKIISISHLKVGSSPLYYLPEHKNKLELFLDRLHDKERTACTELRQKRVLRDEALPPVVRVAIRNAKDFAVPLEVTHHGKKEIFWKYYLLDNTQVYEEIKKILSPPEPKKEERKEEKKEEEREEPAKEWQKEGKRTETDDEKKVEKKEQDDEKTAGEARKSEKKLEDDERRKDEEEKRAERKKKEDERKKIDERTDERKAEKKKARRAGRAERRTENTPEKNRDTRCIHEKSQRVFFRHKCGNSKLRNHQKEQRDRP